MIRFLYRCLLGLHPAAFRERYAGEMLWIFDEAAGSSGAAPFFTDGLVSLARQWLVRSSAWTMAAGGLFAFVLMGGMLSMASFPARHVAIRDFDDWPVPAAYGPPGEFDGHWSGYFQFPGPTGQMEFTLSRENGVWGGALQVQGVDGAMHPGVAEDIRVGANWLTFRFKTKQGDLAFHGRMVQGKLRGYVRAADTAYQ